MKVTYRQQPGNPRPKRGDLLQTNIGDRRERTWIILRTHSLPTLLSDGLGFDAQRTSVWAERWWEIEPDMRNTLYRSAERNGGQVVHPFHRLPSQRRSKPTFEQYMVRYTGQ